MPLEAVEQATRTQPFPPAGNVESVSAAVPVIRAPLSVMQEQGIPLATHSKPDTQAEFAANTCPFVPTVSARGVAEAEAESKSPFARKAEG